MYTRSIISRISHKQKLKERKERKAAADAELVNNRLTASYSEAPETADNNTSAGLLSLNTPVDEAIKDLQKRRKFAQTEGTQGQVILG